MRYHFGALMDYSSRSLTQVRNLNVTFHLRLLCIGLMLMGLGWHVWRLQRRLDLPSEFYLSAQPPTVTSLHADTTLRADSSVINQRL